MNILKKIKNYKIANMVTVSALHVTLLTPYTIKIVSDFIACGKKSDHVQTNLTITDGKEEMILENISELTSVTTGERYFNKGSVKELDIRTGIIREVTVKFREPIALEQYEELIAKFNAIHEMPFAFEREYGINFY